MLEDLLICQHCGTSAQPMISPGMGGAGRGGKGGGGGEVGCLEWGGITSVG